MTVERLSPEQLSGLSADDVANFIESDFRIRSGLCPNDCGLMHELAWGQQCGSCGFSCNKPAEKGAQQ